MSSKKQTQKTLDDTAFYLSKNWFITNIILLLVIFACTLGGFFYLQSKMNETVQNITSSIEKSKVDQANLQQKIVESDNSIQELSSKIDDLQVAISDLANQPKEDYISAEYKFSFSQNSNFEVTKKEESQIDILVTEQVDSEELTDTIEIKMYKNEDELSFDDWVASYKEENVSSENQDNECEISESNDTYDIAICTFDDGEVEFIVSNQNTTILEVVLGEDFPPIALKSAEQITFFE